MRCVIQRVAWAKVNVDEKLISAISSGLLVFVGIEDVDTIDDAIWLSNKIVNLRIFNDENAVPNLSVKDILGEIILVSQFTLHALTKKGNRPSYIKASKPEHAVPLYQKLIECLEMDLGRKIQTGVFGADMKVELLNDGPITIWIDTQMKA